MVSVGSLFRHFVVVCLLLVGAGAQTAKAGAWSDYVGVATSIFEEDNRRLNTRLRPVQRGTVKLLVRVRQTGVIKEVRVLESSGIARLDAATVASITELSALPTPPASVYFKQFFTPLIFTYVFDPGAVPDLVPEQRTATPVAPIQAAEPTIPEKQSIVPDPVVVRLQTALIAAGYEPGPIDGLYGRGTANAIKAYQQDNGLVVDGVPSEALVNAITSQLQSAAVTESDREENVSSPESGITPPATGIFSLNREIVEDYDYGGNRQLEDYESID